MKKPDMMNDPVGYAREVVGKDPLATFLGITVEEVRNGYARCAVTVRPEFLNAVERAHGALVHAVADQAFAVGSNSTGTMALAVSFQISYLAAASDGERIFAEAVPVSVGRKISVWNIVVPGSEDRMIASGQGVAYHK
jgi:acyl-CoA thioesterase